MNLFRFLNDLIKYKKLQKGDFFCAGPRGCDVALRATWLCHVDACECLRGTSDVIFIISIIIMVIVHISIR